MTGSRKDVRLRLQNAALELYAERGFDQVTAAEIAAQAGVTERTFFRHFPDKREVLFDGEAALQALLTKAVANAPGPGPLPLLLHAFLSVVPHFESDRELKARRHQVVWAAPELKERSVTKMARLTEALAQALEQRGIPRPAADLAAACGMGVLTRVRLEWLAGTPSDYATLLTDAFAELRLLLRDEPAAPSPAGGVRS